MKRTMLLLLSIALTACGANSSLPQNTPTLSLPPSATPTSIPSPTSTPEPTLTATPYPGGPCDNPLVPLVTGSPWTYRVSSVGGDSQYIFKVAGRQDGGNIVALVEYTDLRNNLVVQDPVVCVQGAIENYPLFLLNMLLANYLNGYIDTYHESGIYAPSHPTLDGSNWVMDWQAEYLTEAKVYLKNPIGGPDLFILTSTPINLSFSMDGTRIAVQSPAGDFPQAIKISMEYAMNVSITVPGSGSGTSDRLTLRTSQVYEPYVGLVRAQIDSASLSGNIPVPIENMVELIEYKP
jgi:hypothetical protein